MSYFRSDDASAPRQLRGDSIRTNTTKTLTQRHSFLPNRDRALFDEQSPREDSRPPNRHVTQKGRGFKRAERQSNHRPHRLTFPFESIHRFPGRGNGKGLAIARHGVSETRSLSHRFFTVGSASYGGENHIRRRRREQPNQVHRSIPRRGELRVLLQGRTESLQQCHGHCLLQQYFLLLRVTV